MVDYVDRAGFARVLGVSYTRVCDLEKSGKLPRAEATLEGRPLWRREIAQDFADKRRQRRN